LTVREVKGEKGERTRRKRETQTPDGKADERSER